MTDDGRLLALGLGLVGLGAAAARRGSRVRTVPPPPIQVFVSSVGGYEGQDRSSRAAVVVIDEELRTLLRRAREVFGHGRKKIGNPMRDLGVRSSRVAWFSRFPVELAPRQSADDAEVLQSDLDGSQLMQLDLGDFDFDLGKLHEAESQIRTNGIERMEIGVRGVIFMDTEKYSDAHVEMTEIPWDSIFPPKESGP